MKQISVVVPTFNAGADITRLIAALRAQKPAPPFEIIAIDSGSSDDTRQRVLDGGGRFVELKTPFNHGLARDAGIAAAAGELIFLTVQDAYPADESCLERMARHFEDAQVAGVSSRQIPPLEGPAELRIKAELDLRGAEMVRKTNLTEHPDYTSYSPEERVELYRFDNVGAMLRRDVWAQIHFGPCDYAEDLLWAKRALESGRTIVRDFTAPMIHAHRRTFSYEFRRGLLDARVMDELFGYRYRLVKKLNRVKMLASHGGGESGRGAAFKTYSAHVLSRIFYGAYRSIFRPLGLGKTMMRRWTGGI